MEFLLLKAASAPPPIKMAHKIVLAILEESTTLLSHLCQSMPLLAIAPQHSMELSRELATAVSLMLSTCKQDKYALLVAMHPAVYAVDLSMVLFQIAIATAASSSMLLPQIFQLTPQIAPASSKLTQLWHHWMQPTQPMALLWDPFLEVNAHAALEKLIWSDRSTNVLHPHNWLSATNASMSPMESEEPISATVSAPTLWILEAPLRS